jgi:2-dehydropantoate 2-reductase
MGQGPHRPLIIGNGRLSRHLQHYFRSAGITFRLWHRQQDQTLASQLPGTTHILLAISDRAIQDFLHENDFGDRTVVHFSGSIVTPKAWGAHPLMTFTDQLYGLAEYRSIPFILDAEAPDLEALLPGLTNPQFRIATSDKARYHALCVLAGNFSVMLWNRLFQGLSEIGIPYQVALPYLRQVTEVIAQSPGQLSGPLVRDDKTTLNSNLDSLAGDPYQSVYQSFVQAFGANPATAPALALEVAV